MPIYNEVKAATGIQFVYNEAAQALGLLIEVEGGHRIIFEATGSMLTILWLQLRDELASVPRRKQWRGTFPAPTADQRDEWP